MLPLLETHREAIASLCQRFHIQRLEVFGSAARMTDFDPERSDVDLLVTYAPDAPVRGLRNYFDLQRELEALLGRSVDLITAGTVRNPYIHANIERGKQLVYAA